MARVITYQHAYVGGTSTLCTDHADAPPESLPALGPVEHGEHEGVCRVCADREARIRDGRAAAFGAEAAS